MEYYEIRCPCEKVHDISGVEYDRCGIMLGAIKEGDACYFRCPTCGMIYADFTDTLVIEVLGKNKINFNKTWRRIINE